MANILVIPKYNLNYEKIITSPTELCDKRLLQELH